jgi:hypothetical protein
MHERDAAGWRRAPLVDRDAFDRRLAKLEELLGDLRRIAPKSPGDRNAFLADRGWRSPRTYRETFEILRDHGVLDAELCVAMQGWAGLRNVLAHLYIDVDHARICGVLERELDQLDRFAAAVAHASGAG